MPTTLIRTISKMSTTTKFTISALPLPPKSYLLTHALTPDPHTPSVAAFRNKVLVDKPSIQRRARLLSSEAHFSHVSPLPLPFPFEIEFPKTSEVVEDKEGYIEQWLSKREALVERTRSGAQPTQTLKLFTSEIRDDARELLGISETALRDCLPHLEVGDAFATLGVPTLANSFDDEGGPSPSDSEDVVAARQELIDVLSGHAVLNTDGDAEVPFAPWSLRYSGHQFGSWAGQLGDGRAISILVTPHPSDPELTYELQLKGAGRTPFSRTADGLAVLRSSIREYLCSEAMQALGIPTTRALSIVSLTSIAVAREKMETASIVTRMAPSFIRIGNFEAFNGPTNMFFFGGGQQEPHYEGLRILGEWVTDRVLKLKRDPGAAWGQQVVLDVARRNAKMVAGWQAYGFMHGVINTDNVSILGLTIDYGPYAFMDVFDQHHICNHTDESGRYAYKYQPNMIIYALRALLNALAPLIGAEIESGGKAVGHGWAANASKEEIEAWSKKAIEKVKDEMERVAQETTAIEYGRLMRKRLGLRRQDAKDETRLFKPLLTLMEDHKLDFHGTFRKLCSFRSSLLDAQIPAKDAPVDPKPTDLPPLQALITDLLGLCPEPERMDHGKATEEWLRWLDTYAARIKEEQEEWVGSTDGGIDEARAREMRQANPRFVLRQWVLEEVIAKATSDPVSGRRILAKVMHMASNPFEPWGAEDDDRPDEDLDAEEKEERRYCSLGEKRMLGFQCSCSS
ncbi:hypothetical protein HGRIS_003440 [Hohenbuehelia grisea]|uniref:Selenoprotein O n=1 Tax=Hohenbuehelia grisea TaxID=104357 RepID=A0ABR3JGE2_9AGAR